MFCIELVLVVKPKVFAWLCLTTFTFPWCHLALFNCHRCRYITFYYLKGQHFIGLSSLIMYTVYSTFLWALLCN